MTKYLDMYADFVYRPAKKDFCCSVELEAEEGEYPLQRFYSDDLQALIYRLWGYYLAHWRVLNGDEPPPATLDVGKGLKQHPLWD